MDPLRALNPAWGYASLVLVMLVAGVFVTDQPAMLPEAGPITPEAQAYMRQLLATPVLTPDEWQRACDPMHGKKFAGVESLDSHCSIQVVVDCPPDCGVYKILREDKLLRRVW